MNFLDQQKIILDYLRQAKTVIPNHESEIAKSIRFIQSRKKQFDNTDREGIERVVVYLENETADSLSEALRIQLVSQLKQFCASVWG